MEGLTRNSVRGLMGVSMEEMRKRWNILAVKWIAEEGVRGRASIVSKRGWYVFWMGQMCVVH